MKAIDINGKEMVHPDVVKDIVNDSMRGAIQYRNYCLDYEEAKNSNHPLGY